jgi:hypothetical protein
LALETLTTITTVVIISNMKATELLHTRVAYSENTFAELVLWQLPKPYKGSPHSYKYRLAYVVDGECVLRYDNETGKGDHRHYAGRESKYAFSTPEKLIADFQRDIKRWNDEDSNS